MRAYRRLHKLILVGNFYFLITNLQLYTKGPPDLGQYKGSTETAHQKTMKK